MSGKPAPTPTKWNGVPQRGSVMGQPIPYRWLVITGVLLALIAVGLFWWATWEQSRKGPVFLFGLGFLAASGVLGCVCLGAYQMWCCIRRHRHTPPLE